MEGTAYESLAPFLLVRKASYRVVDLEQTIERVENLAGNVDFTAATDIRTGTVWFSTYSAAEAERLETDVAEAALPIPAANIVVTANGGIDVESNSFAGLNLNEQPDGAIECTTGFSVEPSDGTGEEGVSTAGHAENALEFNNGDKRPLPSAG
jgi:hypothetical protein